MSLGRLATNQSTNKQTFSLSETQVSLPYLHPHPSPPSSPPSPFLSSPCPLPPPSPSTPFTPTAPPPPPPPPLSTVVFSVPPLYSSCPSRPSLRAATVLVDLGKANSPVYPQHTPNHTPDHTPPHTHPTHLTPTPHPPHTLILSHALISKLVHQPTSAMAGGVHVCEVDSSAGQIPQGLPQTPGSPPLRRTQVDESTQHQSGTQQTKGGRHCFLSVSAKT